MVKAAGKKRKKKKKKLMPGDFWMMTFTLILVLFGVIMVFSASYYSSISETGHPWSFLIKHSVFAVLGSGAMILGAAIDYHRYANRRFVLIVTAGSILLLLLLFTPLGVEVNGATRWIDAGLFTLMPGEISKLAVILFTAWFLSVRPERITSFSRGVLPLIALMSLYGMLICMQPNLSTAITVCGIVVAVMLVAGMKWRYLFMFGGAGFAGIMTILTFYKGSYKYDRLVSFLHPFDYFAGEGYQVCQSLIALGAGGLSGVGIGRSVQKTFYLPEPQNDFILSIIGEELGFAGILILIVIYCLFIWRGARIAMKAPDTFGLLLGSGIVLMVAIQVILNIAVVTSSMPPTGINLPFISYGGNALLLFMFSAGVLINISRQGKKIQE